MRRSLYWDKNWRDPEVVLDRETGFICELGAIEEITEKAVQLLKDEELHNRFSQHGMKVAKEYFHGEKIVSQYEQIYYQLLKCGEVDDANLYSCGSCFRKNRGAGFEAYFVGGSVRDFVLGKEVADVDIATSATPQEIKRISAKRLMSELNMALWL